MVPVAGVPLKIPVEGSNVTPEGNAPVSENVDAGNPLAVTVNEPGTPTVSAVFAALVIVGGSFTVMVMFWVAFGLTPFCAVILRG